MEYSSLEIDPSRSAPPEDSRSVDKLHQLLSQLWITSKTTVAERLETIRFAQARLEDGDLDDVTRQLALDAAHKLAGILGTFGIPVGTELARQVEVLLQAPSETDIIEPKSLSAILNQLSNLIDQKSSEVPSA